MKGLLIKELVSTKGLVTAFGVGICLMIFYGMIGLDVASFVVFFIGLLASVNLFDFDFKCNWDQYVVTLPVRRKDIVKARYLIIAFMVLAAAVFGMLFTVIFNKVPDIKSAVFTNLLVTSIVFVYLAVYIPLLYKFGIIKGRYLSLLAFAIFAVVVYFMGFKQSVLNDIGSFIMSNMSWTIDVLPYIALPVALIIYWLSHLCACRIYENTDF